MRILIIVLLHIIPFTITSQFYVKKDHLEYGFNIGTYVANNNTSVLYDAHSYVATTLESAFNPSNQNFNYSSAINYLDAEFGGDSLGNRLLQIFLQKCPIIQDSS